MTTALGLYSHNTQERARISILQLAISYSLVCPHSMHFQVFVESSPWLAGSLWPFVKNV